MYNKLQVIVYMQACVYVFIYTFFSILYYVH